MIGESESRGQQRKAIGKKKSEGTFTENKKRARKKIL